jgi:hypothetical protein
VALGEFGEQQRCHGAFSRLADSSKGTRPTVRLPRGADCRARVDCVLVVYSYRSIEGEHLTRRQALDKLFASDRVVE